MPRLLIPPVDKLRGNKMLRGSADEEEGTTIPGNTWCYGEGGREKVRGEKCLKYSRLKGKSPKLISDDDGIWGSTTM